jgi:hypothetical protein
MSANLTKEIQVSTDGTLAANSDVKAPTQKAVKTYIDGKAVAVTDATLPTSDITTNDFSPLKHGFAPKNDGNAAHIMTGEKTYVAATAYDAEYPTWYDMSITVEATPTGTAYDTHGCLHTSNATVQAANAADSHQSTCHTLRNQSAAILTISYTGTLMTAPGTGQLVFGREAQYSGYLRLVSNTFIRVFIGLTGTHANDIAASDMPLVSANCYAMFRYSTSAQDTTWKFLVSDGNIIETIDTGVTIASTVSDMQRFEVRCDGTGTNSFAGYINGVKVAQGTINPTLYTNLHHGVVWTNLEAAAKDIKIMGHFARGRYVV